MPNGILSAGTLFISEGITFFMTLSIYGEESKFEFYVDHDNSIAIYYECEKIGHNDVIYLNKEAFDKLVSFINESYYEDNKIKNK